MSDLKIATGYWKNHSNSGWLAASLTLDVRTAAILIASAATFITIVGTRFWSIVSFLVHQLRATTLQRDGIHHQHQVIYKNASTPLGAIWLMTQVFWAWRGNARRNFLRYVAFSLPPLASFAVFTAAGIMSSRVAAPTNAASMVIVQPNNCGFLEFTDPEDPNYSFQAGSVTYGTWSTGKAREATSYARSCYGNVTQVQAGCHVYPVQELPYTTNTAAKCPFRNASRCLLGENTAFELTTSWLDTHHHLGINAPARNRVRFRRVTTCSVLYVEDLIKAYPLQGSDVNEYYLGPRGSAVEGVLSTNFTYQWKESTFYDGLPYSIASDKAVVLDPFQSRGWQPMGDLNRSDADVSVFFLNSNSMAYLNPVSDPFFSANRIVTSALPNGNFTFYGADRLTQVMGCTDQFQIQNPNSNVATELTSSIKAYAQAYGMGLNAAQSAAVARLNLRSYDSLLFNSVNGLSAAALHAADIAFGTGSPGLPDDQWRIEVTGWFNASLATLQDRVVSFVSKDMRGAAGIAKVTMPSGLPDLIDMCHNQVVKNIGAYQTFSVLGLSIIAVVGSFIIVLSWFIEPIGGWVESRTKKKNNNNKKEGCTKTAQWLFDSALHLQTLNFQRDGLGGTWSKCDGSVPVSQAGQKWSLSKERTRTPVSSQKKHASGYSSA